MHYVVATDITTSVVRAPTPQFAIANCMHRAHKPLAGSTATSLRCSDCLTVSARYGMRVTRVSRVSQVHTTTNSPKSHRVCAQSVRAEHRTSSTPPPHSSATQRRATQHSTTKTHREQRAAPAVCQLHHTAIGQCARTKRTNERTKQTNERTNELLVNELNERSQRFPQSTNSLREGTKHCK